MNKLIDRVVYYATRLDSTLVGWVRWYESLPRALAVRGAGALLATPAWIVLGLARWLEPAAEGFGTHRQLGLAGCTVMTLTGWPCPMCGMTTTFALMADGEFLKACINQPFGPVLFGITFVVGVLGGLDLLTAKGFLGKAMKLLGPYEQKLAMGLLFGLFGGWLWKMVHMHPETFGLTG